MSKALLVEITHEDQSGEERETSTAMKLKQVVERIERLTQERDDISQDIKEIYAEAKAFGLDTKTIRKLVSIRKVNMDKFKEEMMLLETYANSLQMELFS